jgi:hypothetical protein
VALVARRSTESLGVDPEMARTSLRMAAIYCLAIWAAIWLLFLLMRLSSFDIRIIPGIGPVMLIALVVVLIAPIVAMGVAGATVLRQPRVVLNWLTFGCAIAALLCQVFLFTITTWL